MDDITRRPALFEGKKGGVDLGREEVEYRIVRGKRGSFSCDMIYERRINKKGKNTIVIQKNVTAPWASEIKWKQSVLLRVTVRI